MFGLLSKILGPTFSFIYFVKSSTFSFYTVRLNVCILSQIFNSSCKCRSWLPDIVLFNQFVCCIVLYVSLCIDTYSNIHLHFIKAPPVKWGDRSLHIEVLQTTNHLVTMQVKWIRSQSHTPRDRSMNICQPLLVREKWVFPNQLRVAAAGSPSN